MITTFDEFRYACEAKHGSVRLISPDNKPWIVVGAVDGGAPVYETWDRVTGECSLGAALADEEIRRMVLEASA